MLLLTRRVGESIMIGDDVVVSINGVNGNQVRVGIQAPREIAVHREEIYQRIHGANGDAGLQRDAKGWIRGDVPARHFSRRDEGDAE